MPGYSIGLISVRQPEPELRQVTPLALATCLTRLTTLNNLKILGWALRCHLIVGLSLNKEYFCNEMLMEGAGYFHGMFM